MKRERSTSRWAALATTLGAVLVVSGIVVTTLPASAQESSRAAEERQLVELRARQEQELRARQVLAEEELAARRAERAAREQAVRGRLRESQAPRHRLRIAGLGGEWAPSRGLSAERVLASAAELELDDAQIERIRAAHRDHRRAQIERDAAIEVAELDLDELLDADSLDLQGVESKMMDIAALRVQGRVAELRLREQVESALTAEQRDKLDDMGHSYLFRVSGDGPGRYLFRGNPGESWDHMFDGRLRERLHEGLEPLREMRWFHRGGDCPCDDDDDDRQDDEEQGGGGPPAGVRG